MYIEATSRSTGDNAKLQVTLPRVKSSSCLTFYYHTKGWSVATLNVYNGNVKIFTKSGFFGWDWMKVTRTVYLSDMVSIIYTL